MTPARQAMLLLRAAPLRCGPSLGARTVKFHTSRGRLAKVAKAPKQRAAAPPKNGKPQQAPPSASHLRTSPAQPARSTPRPPPPSASTTSSSSPQPEKETLATLFAQRKLPLVAAGLAAACMGLYVSLVVSSTLSSSSSPACGHGHGGPAGGAAAGSDAPTGRPPELREGKVSATQFDAGLDWPEWLMGVTKLRRQMARLARGHVLEVAVGTGRSVPYYDWEEIKAEAPRPPPAEGEAPPERPSPRAPRERSDGPPPDMLSFTGVDISADVLDVAWTKLKKAVPELVPKRKRRRGSESPAPEPGPASAAAAATPAQGGGGVLAVDLGEGRIRLFQADAEDALPAPPAAAPGPPPSPQQPARYDTILQSFGLCSVADPAGLLANMAAALRPGTGRIVLLEHGRGWSGLVNGLLDRFAPGHFARFGCWWNRDIEAIVREAAGRVPGLEVVRVERPLLLQFGTTLWVELRVRAPGEGEPRQQGRARGASRWWAWLTDRDVEGRD